MSKIPITSLLLVMLLGMYFTPKKIFAKEKILKSDNLKNNIPLRKDQILSPVVRLTMMTNDPKNKKTAVYHATAFSISYAKKNNLSYLLTNAHFCTLGDKSGVESILFAENSDTFRGKLPLNISFPGKIAKIKKENDLCIVVVVGKINPVKMGPKNYMPKQLESITTVGAPGGVFPIITKTNVSAIVERKKTKLGEMLSDGNPIGMLSAKVYPGQSGSPVYNENGEVIGILFSATHTYGGFFILNSDIYDFVQ